MNNYQVKASKFRPVDPARPPWVATGPGPQCGGTPVPHGETHLLRQQVHLECMLE